MMDFQFVMQEPITMLFQVGGAAPEPEPQPEPVPIYSDFTPVLSALQGNITDNWEEEETNGNSGIHNS